VTRLRAGRQGFDSPQELGTLLFTITSRPVLGFTQPLIHWIPRALLQG